MYGVPADLPVQQIVGDYLCQVCVGMDGVHFSFGHSGTISVGGRWELTDANGKTVDCACEYEAREAYRVHAIFNQDVISAIVDPPKSFSLTFANGYRLTVYDDSEKYESFSYAGFHV